MPRKNITTKKQRRRYKDVNRDYEEESNLENVNLTDFVTQHPTLTFLMMVEDSYNGGFGILAGDILIVNRAIKPQVGDLVVVEHLGESIIGKIEIENGEYWLSDNNILRLFRGDTVTLGLSDLDEDVFGRITHLIRDFRDGGKQ
jgi:SOS-response transcriptional repressor LexA